MNTSAAPHASRRPEPEFGADVALRNHACTPFELFSGLFFDLENSVHLLRPAYEFSLASVDSVQAPTHSTDADALLAELQSWGEAQLAELGTIDVDVLQLVREFAPVGLSDGAWLTGALLSNAVECEAGMRLLKQMMMRFGGPGIGDSHAERYAALLRSLDVSPKLIERARATLRLAGDASRHPCTDNAYERALLGLCLAQFPMSFGAELVGFNLWMVLFGGAPVLRERQAELTTLGADLRYFEQQDTGTLQLLGRQAVREYLAQSAIPAVTAEGIARGFAAAQASYARWCHALGSNEAPLGGTYTAPQDSAALTEFALGHYGQLSSTEFYYRIANFDLYPAVRLFARHYVADVFEKVALVLEQDPRLNSQVVPAYSEQTIAELVEGHHQANVKARELPNTSLVSSNSDQEIKGIQEVFDGCWLQGLVDVRRAGYEEYGWLFRIYASEHGDGDFAWNHCQIFRKAFGALGSDVMLPKTDPKLYELFEISTSALVSIAISLNTRRFLPELLGINLSIESTGVGGSYIDQWREAEQVGNPWRALAWRLHNSIDNYADGHTKWSLSAVQSFMRRVRDCSPERVNEEWSRIWRLWRCRYILVHGTEEEQAVLEGYFAPDTGAEPDASAAAE